MSFNVIDNCKSKFLKRKIEELNEQIDKNYENYMEHFNDAKNKKNDIRIKCERSIYLINTEKSFARNDIEKLSKFLMNFGKLTEVPTLFDFEVESGIKSNAISLLPKIEKASYQDVGTLFKRLQCNRKSHKNKEIEFLSEQTKQEKQLKEITYSTKTCKSIMEMVELYRVTVQMVRDAVKNMQDSFELVEAFMIAYRIKNAIINKEKLLRIEAGDYEIELYRNTPYERYYNFVKNTFDYYQLLVKIYEKDIIGNIIDESKVNDEKLREFEKQIEAVKYETEKIQSSTVWGEKNE